MIVQEGSLKQTRLLQTSLAKLSTIKSNEGAIKSITNCSFFTSEYVVGRNQGDEKNDTYSDANNGKFCDVVIFKDGTYKAGKFNNWDYTENVVAGFSPAAILIQNGADCDLFSEAITNSINIVKTKNHRTAFAITKDGKALQIVGENLTGYEVRDELKANYDIEMLAILDGGGSTEMIVDGKIVNTLKDGSERSMLNGLAFIKTEEPEEKQNAIHPIRAMIGVTQGMNGSTSHVGLKAIDFGWNSKYSNSKVLYAPFDGKVVARIGNTNTIAFQSNEEVKWADGTTDYMTVITAHDNNAPKLGAEFKQGEVYSHMGTATGVACHCHMEVQKGKYQKYTGSKKTGQYYSLIFPNTVEPYKALFLAKGTVLGKSAMYDWVYEPEENNVVTEPTETTEDWKTKYEELSEQYVKLNEEKASLSDKLAKAKEKAKEIADI